MIGSAELPWWAVEVALTIERPATGTPAERWDPFAPEPGARRQGGAAQALLLLRAPGRMRWLEAIAEAMAEVETLAGVRSATTMGEAAEDRGGWRGPRLLPFLGQRPLPGPGRLLTGPGPRLLPGAALPGLTPVTATVALAHLQVAGPRGLPAPLRRRQPGNGAVEPAWRAGAGSVLTCDGPDGRSAQAVVALRGMGTASAITPPPGGALVLRAWRARQGWGMACGLVLGAAATAGLGRAAGRVAAIARTEGWDATVLSGSTAMRLARAGSPGLPAPQEPAQAASRTLVAERFAACLAAGALDGRAAGSFDGRAAGLPSTLAVTP